MAGKYKIYKLTSPSGKCYVGLTGQTIKERWQGHVKKAKTAINHPLYNAIRKYGAAYFEVVMLASDLSQIEAGEREKIEIAVIDKSLSYNLSEGGETDGAYGSKAFWVKLNADPKAKQDYLRKLSEVKTANDWSDYSSMSALAKKWRASNSKEAYKNSRRASRIARKLNPTTEVKEVLSLKERLRRKHNLNDVKRQGVLTVWANRTDTEKQTIFKNISLAKKEKNKGLSKEQKNEMVKNARACINRQVQGPAASKGIKSFWVELKKDPVKYAEYMGKRTASLMKTIEGKK